MNFLKTLNMVKNKKRETSTICGSGTKISMVLTFWRTTVWLDINQSHFSCCWRTWSIEQMRWTPQGAFCAPGDCLPGFSWLTWQSLAALQRSCTRDWNENKAEWLLSDVWYMTCNGMFPEIPLHMAAYSPPDLAWTVSENNWAFSFNLTAPRRGSERSLPHLDITKLMGIYI